MTRKKLLAANWKMNLDRAGTRDYFTKFLLEFKKNDRVEILFAGNFLILETMMDSAKSLGLRIAAQNVHFEESGAFTGEISWAMLSDIGVSEALIGHSERRQYFGETDELIAKKMQTAEKLKMRTVLCVGENLAERKSDQTFAVIRNQLAKNLAFVSHLEKVVIAYEPVWAIGTGLSATSEEAQVVHQMIRKQIEENFSKDAADKILILYGGSMNLKNVKELCSQRDIDGGLVGGASLKPEEFAKMYSSL